MENQWTQLKEKPKPLRGVPNPKKESINKYELIKFKSHTFFSKNNP